MSFVYTGISWFAMQKTGHHRLGAVETFLLGRVDVHGAVVLDVDLGAGLGHLFKDGDDLNRGEKSLGKHRIMCERQLMRIDLKEDVVSLTDFARNTKQHAKELALGGRARILTQNGKASVVVLSLDAFEKMASDADEYRMDLRLRDAIESYAAGERGAPVKTVMDRLRKRAGQRRIIG